MIFSTKVLCQLRRVDVRYSEIIHSIQNSCYINSRWHLTLTASWSQMERRGIWLQHQTTHCVWSLTLLLIHDYSQLPKIHIKSIKIHQNLLKIHSPQLLMKKPAKKISPTSRKSKGASVAVLKSRTRITPTMHLTVQYNVQKNCCTLWSFTWEKQMHGKPSKLSKSTCNAIFMTSRSTQIGFFQYHPMFF